MSEQKKEDLVSIDIKHSDSDEDQDKHDKLKLFSVFKEYKSLSGKKRTLIDLVAVFIIFIILLIVFFSYKRVYLGIKHPPRFKYSQEVGSETLELLKKEELKDKNLVSEVNEQEYVWQKNPPVVVHVANWNGNVSYEGETDFIRYVENEDTLFSVSEHSFNYTNVATLENKDTLVYVDFFFTDIDGIDHDEVFLFVVDELGKVSLLDKYPNSYFSFCSCDEDDSYSPSLILRRDVALSSIVVPEISPRVNIEHGGNLYLSEHLGSQWTRSLGKVWDFNPGETTLLQNDEKGSFYRVDTTKVSYTAGDHNLDNFLRRQFVLQTPDNRVHYYRLDNLPVLEGEYSGNPEKAMILWKNKVDGDSTFYGNFSDCEGHGPRYIVTNNISDKDFFEVGTLEVNAESIYHLKEGKALNELYSIYRTGKTDLVSDEETLSLEEFNQTDSYFIVKNKVGDYQVFINHEFLPITYCSAY